MPKPMNRSQGGASHLSSSPTVLLPGLLPLDICAGLIELFENRVTIEGTVSRIDQYGIARNVVDYDTKRRRDLRIPPADPLHETLRNRLLSRCTPAILAAFKVQVAHVDRLLIARYDDCGGWFRRHRENVTEEVAFRQFAVSVNLNTEEYEGSHLLFPEYDSHCIRAPAGAGLVFPDGILHEAAPVISGLRYVLLTFLYSEAAEAGRRARLHALETDSPAIR